MNSKDENAAILAHMPLVYSILRKLNIRGAGFEDAVQVGRIAVLRAVRSFKPEAGAKLTTWAYARIRWDLQDWLDGETRVRTGRPFESQHGGAGNEASDWAPKTTDIAGSGGESEGDGACTESGDELPDDLEVSTAVRRALAGASRELQDVAASLVMGETQPEAAARLGVSKDTVGRRKKALCQVLDPFRDPWAEN